MKNEYNELADLFRNVESNARQLVEIFEKDKSKEETYTWHLCEEDNPKESGYYSVAFLGDNNRYLDTALYSADIKKWHIIGRTDKTYEEVTGFAPSAWLEVSFPEFLKGIDNGEEKIESVVQIPYCEKKRKME